MIDIEIALITVLPILIYKLSVLVVGYLVAKMGYQLLIKGVTGEFKFKSNLQGFKADLVSASPGTFFVLLGVLMMIISITKDNPYNIKTISDEIDHQVTIPEKLPKTLPEGFK